MVYAIKKFQPYLVCSKVIVYTDHSSSKYLQEKNAKACLLRCVLFLQEFDLDIRDKLRAENVDLSRFTIESHDLPINGALHDEHLLALALRVVPCLVDIANYLACGIFPFI